MTNGRSYRAQEGGVDAQLARAKVAVSIAFIGAGFGFASWASRIPQVRDRLGMDPGQLGLVLLSLAVGSLIALPLAGIAVGRFGAARIVAVASCVVAAALCGIGLGYEAGIAPVAVSLFASGFAFGMWDVAMNVHGSVVEQRLGRTILSRFHAGFSIGTVAGAGIGAAAVALGIGVAPHLLACAVLIAAVVPAGVRAFLVVEAPVPTTPTPTGDDDDGPEPRGAFAAWGEPRTLLIGLFVLSMAFSEGTGNDWLAVAMIDGYDVSTEGATATFALFLTALTFGRWYGPGVLDRYGRVPVLRASALAAAVGLGMVVFGSSVPIALTGTALWGLGTALGFPIGISAAADDPVHAAQRVSVASSIGYVAFLGGPPAIGVLGDHVGTLRSLTVALGLLAVAALVSGATRPSAPAASLAWRRCAATASSSVWLCSRSSVPWCASWSRSPSRRTSTSPTRPSTTCRAASATC